MHKKKYPSRHLAKLKKLIINQLEIHKKAQLVMSDKPPNVRYSSIFKDYNIKTSRLPSLPPITTPQPKQKDPQYLKSETPAPKVLSITKKPIKLKSIGIVHGISKYFSVRRKSKSQQLNKVKNVSETIQVDTLDLSKENFEEDMQLSPMTIIINNGNK